MGNTWPNLPLGVVLTKSEEWVDIQPDGQYRLVTVRLWGRGVALRNEVTGAEIAASRQLVVRSQQFILSRIDARNGAFGLIPDYLDGAVVSNDFPTFNVDHSQVLPGFLEWMSKTQDFVDLCRAASEGTTNRVRLQVDRFLATEIPLPPLAEQRRIVARIEELAALVEEAQTLRRQSVAEAETLMAAEEIRIWPDESLENALTLNDVTSHLARGRQSEQGDSNHYLIKTRHVQMGQYVETDMTLAPGAAKKVEQEAVAQYGDILIACSAAGCLGRVAQYNVRGKVASTDTHVAIARANEDVVLPEYLYFYLKGAQGQYQLRSRERGDWQREKVGFRLTELNLNDLKRVPVPVPSFGEQRRIIAHLNGLQAQVDELTATQDATQAELDALLPSVLDKAFRGEL